MTAVAALAGTDAAAAEIVLAVDGLAVTYLVDGRPRIGIKGVGFALAKGRTIGIVGESGCGKTTLARAIFGTLPPNARVEAGTVRVGSVDVTPPSRALEAKRWREIAFVPQAALASLDPLYTVEDQVAELFAHHERQAKAEARASADRMLEALGLPAEALRKYPHELSGGMRQRTVIAAALALRPPILIADEPTTALDTLVQRGVFDQFDLIRREIGTSVMLITHDLGLVADYCDDVLVMHRGEVVESGPVKEVLTRPRAAYTATLLAATRELGLGGAAAESVRPIRDDVPLAELRGATRTFAKRAFLGSGATVNAVDDVSLTIRRGEVLGIIGASGSGKSTIANMLIGLDAPSKGDVLFDGVSVATIRGADRRTMRQRMQMVFQDPFQSMNPIYRVEWIVTEPLKVALRPRPVAAEMRRRAVAALEAAGLAPAETYLSSFLHQLSGGQRQRVAIARALVLDPTLIIADEPVSMLDTSVRAGVLRTLRNLVANGERSLVYITHDLATVGFLCDRLAVLRAGRIMETGPTAEVLRNPRSDYTRELLRATPGGTLLRGTSIVHA